MSIPAADAMFRLPHPTHLAVLRAAEMPYDRHFRQGLPFLLNC